MIGTFTHSGRVLLKDDGSGESCRHVMGTLGRCKTPALPMRFSVHAYPEIGVIGSSEGSQVNFLPVTVRPLLTGSVADQHHGITCVLNE